MKKLFSILFYALVILYPCFARGQTNPITPPDLTGWKVINTSRIELRVSDCASVYIGLETDYVNPNNLTEFARVLERHIAIPIEKCREFNRRSVFESATSLITQREEQDLLEIRSKQADEFLCIRWQVKKDPRTEKEIVDGDVDIWFMLSNGKWIFDKSKKIEVEFLTENIGNGKPHNVFSGMLYRIGKDYHILRVSREDIIQLVERAKRGGASRE